MITLMKTLAVVATAYHPDGVDDYALAYRVGAPVVLQKELISQRERARPNGETPPRS
jgi:hypothetical protein